MKNPNELIVFTHQANISSFLNDVVLTKILYDHFQDRQKIISGNKIFFIKNDYDDSFFLEYGILITSSEL